MSNRPRKGDRIKVEPIRHIEDIRKIKELLANQPRNLALFVLGINTNLRASDLLDIRFFHLDGKKAGDSFSIRERKTGKERMVTINNGTLETLEALSKATPDWLKAPDLPIFRSQRGVGEPLTVSSANRLVKSWCAEIGLRGNYGSHTLRKTWGYHQYRTYGIDLPRLMVCFNHSTQRQTLDYLCIQAEEIREVFMNEL